MIAHFWRLEIEAKKKQEERDESVLLRANTAVLRERVKNVADIPVPNIISSHICRWSAK